MTCYDLPKTCMSAGRYNSRSDLLTMCVWPALLNHSFRYFSASSSLDISAWSTEGADALSRCEHCDNCNRDPDSVERKDVTLEAWKVLRVSQAISAEGGRTTLGMLADLVRGAGGGAFEVSGSRGKSKGQGKHKLDLDAVCHGKVDLRRDVRLTAFLVTNPEPPPGCRESSDYTAPFGLSKGRICLYVIHHQRVPCARIPGVSPLAAVV
jgi:hypothetical protein